MVPSSTGVIGERLPAGKIRKAIPKLVRGLGGDNAVEAAEAIMTTDAFPKYASRQLAVGEKTATVSAVAKGAGMICPDMATMLCFIMTDLDIQRKALSKALAAAARHSFNAITVDGDTSTNDSVFILANGVLVHITTEFGHLLRLNSDSNSERIRTPEFLVFFFKDIISVLLSCLGFQARRKQDAEKKNGCESDKRDSEAEVPESFHKTNQPKR